LNPPPTTVIGRGFAQCLLADQKTDIRGNCCGAERSLCIRVRR
jgi:hypothetical protein